MQPMESTPTGWRGIWHFKVSRLNAAGHWIGHLGLRLILGYEFYSAGMNKFNGNNWFGNIQSDFPWPFSVVPADVSWFMATWFEIIGGLALIFGLFTRFFAFSLLILTAVAIYAVHWPDSYDSLGQLWQGYAISNDGFGNFRLPLIFAVMLIPLVLQGAGLLSIDRLLANVRGTLGAPVHDAHAAAAALLVVGAPLLFLMPAYAIVFIVLGLIALGVGWFTG